jgi:hypothetical protein
MTISAIKDNQKIDWKRTLWFVLNKLKFILNLLSIWIKIKI